MIKEVFFPELADYLYNIHCTLQALYPKERALLQYQNCFQLLCAVMLSAQCTDNQVNKVTPILFTLWPDPASMSGADPRAVEKCINSLGFYKTKTDHLIRLSMMLVKEFDSTVPQEMELLTKLPGIGRKSANLIRAEFFSLPGIIVDTHVARCCIRLGIGKSKNAHQLEKRLRLHLKPDAWTSFSHAVNRHGKYICKARNPACRVSEMSCALHTVCPKIGLKMTINQVK